MPNTTHNSTTQNRRVPPSPQSAKLIKELARAVQNARIDRKMRVDDLCKEARITKQTYQRLVKGSPSVSVGIVFTVMEVLSILPHHVSGEARKKPAPRRLSRGS